MKKETLEEVAKIICHTHKTPIEQANEIIKLLQERSYSEYEVKKLLSKFHIATDGTKKFEEEWFEKFKKK